MSRITLKKSNYRTSIPREQISAAVKAVYSNDKIPEPSAKNSKLTIVKKEAAPAIRVAFVAEKKSGSKK